MWWEEGEDTRRGTKGSSGAKQGCRSTHQLNALLRQAAHPQTVCWFVHERLARNKCASCRAAQSARSGACSQMQQRSPVCSHIHMHHMSCESIQTRSQCASTQRMLITQAAHRSSSSHRAGTTAPKTRGMAVAAVLAPVLPTSCCGSPVK
jgi:hypothetical protein